MNTEIEEIDESEEPFGLLDEFDPVFGEDWLTALMPPPYRTAQEVAVAIERAWLKRFRPEQEAT